MRNKILTGIIVALALLLACGDDVTNIYYENINGAVFGNVVPADSGSAELDGLTDHFTPIDANGFFNFANVPPGTYTLIIRPDNHSRRQFRDVVVGSGVTEQFRETAISKTPFPIFAISPQDGATSVSTYLYLRIHSDEYLDPADLNGRTTFQPPLSGIWERDDYPSGSEDKVYYFEPQSEIRPSTTYRLTIAKESLSPSGVDFDEDLVITFTTQDAYVYMQFSPYRFGGRISRRGFRVSATVSRCCDTDSVAKAIRFEPEIPGNWFPGDAYQRCDDEDLDREHDFVAGGTPLLPKTNYLAIIDLGPLGSPAMDTAQFLTEGYEVIDVRPRNGYYDVPIDNGVLIIFNEPMDTLSVRQAFSVTRTGGDAVTGAAGWNDELTDMMWLHPEHPFTTGTYIIKVKTDAKTASGENLDVGWESYFQVL
jgi:hypothetical protein